ncbi:DNA methyltransferase [Streptomyces sp. NPDC057620]|uniref:DNA methyltransferase n=1 Tax=Streptomyces sp. NPDC057620 TaxID=3346185 RepID=UPI0036919D33
MISTYDTPAQKPNPVDDTTFTRPLVKALQQQTEQLAGTIAGPDAHRIASAWVYTTVLAAWCEDHALIPAWLRAEAEPARKHHLDAGGTLLGWLGRACASLTTHQSTACLLDPRYNPITQAAPSEDGARALIRWWSHEAPDLAYSAGKGPSSLTGWLAGDLLQLVADERRKANALCQTPWWICDFLLDRTLVPAIETWPQDLLRVIDPACGTGHLLVWALIGLYRWYRSNGPNHPALPPDAAIRRALAGLHGVELDPLTAAVARLRLTVTAGALLAGDNALPTPLRLHQIPADLRPQIAVGNALLAGQGDPCPPGTLLDDTHHYPRILQRGTYHAVVANPPYITVKDPQTREAIRAAYPGVCTGKFSLSVPFAVLVFDLAIRGGHTATAPAEDGQ